MRYSIIYHEEQPVIVPHLVRRTSDIISNGEDPLIVPPLVRTSLVADSESGVRWDGGLSHCTPSEEWREGRPAPHWQLVRPFPGGRYHITALFKSFIVDLRLVDIDANCVAVYAVLLAGYARQDQGLKFKVRVYGRSNDPSQVDNAYAMTRLAEKYVVARPHNIYTLEDSLAHGYGFMVSRIAANYPLMLVIFP